jgi:aryl-alcohol dehydrogenase-like predicted oxidoreductase
VIETAARLDRTPSQVALSWLLGDRRVTAAIIGARSAEQVAENLIAGDFDLPTDIRQELTDAMPLKLGYPHEWMATNMPNTFGQAEIEPVHAMRLP